ncbi:TetR/AcrR family transcriptional regulator [Paraburkholderia sp. JPY454]|uniref:TetR/AcrR family transcriptional regulator n=1 Tax=Paraburkholderia youngii TaxID=2782701 RepID=A0ABX2NXW5_9BURK|nr:TetR/AcrR family transcriptional regulator [Paraburkholderia youngii]
MLSDPSSSAPTKVAYHHGDLRSALISTGEALLEEQGAPGFTLAECARRAGVSKAAPAHHFGNMHGLLAAIAKKGVDELAERLETALALVEGGPAERLRCVARVYVDFALDRPERFRVMFGPPLPADQYGKTPSAPNDCALYVLEREIAAIQLKGVSQRAIAVFVWSFVHGLSMLLLDHRLVRLMKDGQADRDSLIEDTVQLLSFSLPGRDSSATNAS